MDTILHGDEQAERAQWAWHDGADIVVNWDSCSPNGNSLFF